MRRPSGMRNMTFAQFIVEYYKKQPHQKVVIDPNSGLGEESEDQVVGTEEMAPKAMQLTNMIVMKRRTKGRPVPLLMFSNLLDNYGHKALFQPWSSLEELSGTRTEQEDQERRRRQLQLFPMSIFQRRGEEDHY